VIYLSGLYLNARKLPKGASMYGPNWCYLFSEKEEDLRDFVHVLGWSDKWFVKGSDEHVPRFYLSAPMRMKAENLGAMILSDEEIIYFLKDLRDERKLKE